jgi:undecaprenyl-diphosphatase
VGRDDQPEINFEDPDVSYLQAIVIALVQGVTELFPISSLGHSVLVPAWIGGGWQTLVTQSSQASSESSFYLAYIVALHCATALALLWYFRADWVRIIRGFCASVARSVRERRMSIEGRDERLAWLIVVATIPVGLTGVALEHTFRTLLGCIQIDLGNFVAEHCARIFDAHGNIEALV